MMVYQEGQDDNKDTSDQDQKLLPLMQENDLITLKAIRPEQHFTEPPPRIFRSKSCENIRSARYWSTFNLCFHYLYFAITRVRDA